MSDKMQETAGYGGTGRRIAGSGFKVALGAGVALAGSYIFTRIREKQDTETSLARLEQMLAQILPEEGK